MLVEAHTHAHTINTQAENASKLYPPSAYYLATTLLEAGLNAVNGAIYATILYYACDYAAFVQPDDPVAAVAGFVGVFVATTVAANVRTHSPSPPFSHVTNLTRIQSSFPSLILLLHISNTHPSNTTHPRRRLAHTRTRQAQVFFFALASPNFEVAFLSCSAYTVLAVLLSGCVVTYPVLNPHVLGLQYVSTAKYAFAAVMLHFFQGNPKALDGGAGTVEQTLGALQIDSPATVWGNVLGLVGAYGVFLVGGFLCLKFLFKERR